ncbi:caspase family protein [Flavitalea sp.]|nr:caspase family protein [Flavitalea sp.]
MATIYALLVGINNYPVKPLSGCINDIKAVEDYLQKMYGTTKDITLKLKRITDEDSITPTRANIIAGFDHFNNAAENDTCFFYYSGHGSWSPAPKEFWSEADMRSESFVCIDSRIPGGKDLMDKEMGYLIWKTMAGKKQTRFIVITDCCHCGTITRDLDDSGITDRMMPDASEAASFKEYLGYESTINGIKYYIPEQDPVTGDIKASFRQGNHIHLAASRENQTAKELNIDGLKRGAFTHSLLKILYSVNGRISYRDLINKTGLLVKNLVSDQNPGLHINGSEHKESADDFFLTKVSGAGEPFLVYYDARWKWCIKGGLIHGISTGDEIAIEGIGSTVVTGTPAPDFSTIAELPGMVTGTSIYEAKVISQPNQPMEVSFDPSFSHDQKTMFEKLISENKEPSLKLAKDHAGRFIIRNKGKQIFITKPGSLDPLIKPIEVNTAEVLLFVIERIMLVIKWTALLELTQSSFIRRPYELALYRNTLAGSYNKTDFEKLDLTNSINDFNYLEDEGGEWHQPAFRLSIKNTGQVPLFVSNAYLGFDYSISTEFFEDIQLLAPGNEAWLTFVNEESEEKLVLLNLDETYAGLGYNEITEYLKLFISSQPVDTDKLRQDGLDLPVMKSRSGDDRSPSSIVAKTPVGAFSWATETFGFRIVRPPGKTDIAPGKATTLQSVIIAPHPALKAKAALVSSAITGRSVDSIRAPHTTNSNSFLEPFNFMAGTRSSDQLDILELVDVHQAESVTPETPLVLNIPETDLSDVVAIGYDTADNIYYPIGFGNQSGQIIIEALPEVSPADPAITSRSFTGSIKLYFQKVIGQKLGFKFDYPRLAMVEVDKELAVKFEPDKEIVSKAIAASQNILLFVHGIIGDTESMVKCVRTQTTTKSLVEKADLILSFDYENLHTTIEENAALLKERLSSVGLGSCHSKNLIIVAHSMGGLVSRWFIEKLSGNAVASRLVMLGTPNNGTPWADVRDMAETLLTYALNGAAFLKPWMFVLNIAGKIAGGAQVTLKQMDKDTGIYKSLNDGTDPQIPYVIIAGNTKDIIPNYDKTATALQRIFTRLRKRGLYDTLDLVLFKQANDVAVTDKSITECGNVAGWKHIPELVYVPSDHMNYFNNKVALEKIMTG